MKRSVRGLTASVPLLATFGMGLVIARAEPDAPSPGLAHEPQGSAASSTVAEAMLPDGTLIPSRTLSEDTYPCSECHDEDTEIDPTRRELAEPHDLLPRLFDHGQPRLWCLDCHDHRRDGLRLANGTPVPFERSYDLCGQCHGAKAREWAAGVHGKRVGDWNGPKQVLRCTHCHDPHSPGLRPLTPFFAPKRPLGEPLWFLGGER